MAKDQDRLLLVVAGKVNAGKSSLINALLRRDVAPVGPIAGETKDVIPYAYNSTFEIVDTPGFEDVDQSIAAKSIEALEHADAVLYLINCGEGVTNAGAHDVARILEMGRPFRVLLSRADLIVDRKQRAEFHARSAEQLGMSPNDVLLVTCEPGDAGLKSVSAWFQNLDSNGLAWARVLRYALPEHERELDSAAETWIWSAASAAAVAALLPVPVADIAPITAIQLGLAAGLGKTYGHEIEAKRLREMVGILLVSVVAREAFRQLIKLVPGVGWIASAAIAFATTAGIGKALKAFYADGMTFDEDAKAELRRIAKEESKKAKERFKQDKDLQKQVRNRAKEEST